VIHGDSACGGCGDGEAQRVAKVEEGNAAAVGELERWRLCGQDICSCKVSGVGTVGQLREEQVW